MTLMFTWNAGSLWMALRACGKTRRGQNIGRGMPTGREESSSVAQGNACRVADSIVYLSICVWGVLNNARVENAGGELTGQVFLCVLNIFYLCVSILQTE